LADRKEISKEVKKLREKLTKQQKKQTHTHFGTNEPIVPFTGHTKGSTYIPFLMDYFEIESIKPVFSKVVFYDDLWKKAYRRADSADIHMGGSTNLSHEALIVIHEMNEKIDNITKKAEQEKDNEKKKFLEEQKQTNVKNKEDFFKNHLELFPLFYSTPTGREYVAIDGKYELKLTIDCDLCKILKMCLLTQNVGFLGNSEGWVDLKIKEL